MLLIYPVDVATNLYPKWLLHEHEIRAQLLSILNDSNSIPTIFDLTKYKIQLMPDLVEITFILQLKQPMILGKCVDSIEHLQPPTLTCEAKFSVLTKDLLNQ
jgi:hypothetical protein